MVLMVFFNSRISPRTSTVIFRERSPREMAVVTSAIFRTWPVKFEAIWLTESVKSFHVPETPCTSACPPSFPSDPTSLATRVTSEEKEFNWSTMVLMVFFNSRISPCTSTVIFLLRSPLATAVVTSAMLRTWAVRLPAIRFTESVRSFHTPATPFTFAWPPSFPSDPTSRATRVTSMEKRFNCFTMSFTSVAMRENSPCRRCSPICSGISCERFPFATEEITWAISMVGCTRSEISVLIDSDAALQEPRAMRGISTRWFSFPCLPMMFLAWFSSETSVSFSAMISFSVSQIFPPRPTLSTAMRAEKLPFLTSDKTRSSSRLSISSSLISSALNFLDFAAVFFTTTTSLSGGTGRPSKTVGTGASNAPSEFFFLALMAKVY